MLLTYTYKGFLEELERIYGDNEQIVCVLLMEPHNDEVSDYFYRRFPYYHFRTGKDINIFCPGFNYESNNRIFSTKKFVEFIKEIESLTSWRYYGGTNLLLIRYSNRVLHYDSVYDLNLARMLIDGVINDYRHFMEDIIYNIKYINRECLNNQGNANYLRDEWGLIAQELFCFNRTVYYAENVERLNEYLTPRDFTR